MTSSTVRRFPSVVSALLLVALVAGDVTATPTRLEQTTTENDRIPDWDRPAIELANRVQLSEAAPTDDENPSFWSSRPRPKVDSLGKRDLDERTALKLANRAQISEQTLEEAQGIYGGRPAKRDGWNGRSVQDFGDRPASELSDRSQISEESAESIQGFYGGRPAKRTGWERPARLEPGWTGQIVRDFGDRPALGLSGRSQISEETLEAAEAVQGFYGGRPAKRTGWNDPSHGDDFNDRPALALSDRSQISEQTLEAAEAVQGFRGGRPDTRSLGDREQLMAAAVYESSEADQSSSSVSAGASHRVSSDARREIVDKLDSICEALSTARRRRANID